MGGFRFDAKEKVLILKLIDAGVSTGSIVTTLQRQGFHKRSGTSIRRFAIEYDKLSDENKRVSLAAAQINADKQDECTVSETKEQDNSAPEIVETISVPEVIEHDSIAPEIIRVKGVLYRKCSDEEIDALLERVIVMENNTQPSAAIVHKEVVRDVTHKNYSVAEDRILKECVAGRMSPEIAQQVLENAGYHRTVRGVYMRIWRLQK